jgi:hypothetical protein
MNISLYFVEVTIVVGIAKSRRLKKLGINCRLKCEVDTECKKENNF